MNESVLPRSSKRSVTVRKYHYFVCFVSFCIWLLVFETAFVCLHEASERWAEGINNKKMEDVTVCTIPNHRFSSWYLAVTPRRMLSYMENEKCWIDENPTPDLSKVPAPFRPFTGFSHRSIDGQQFSLLDYDKRLLSIHCPQHYVATVSDSLLDFAFRDRSVREHEYLMDILAGNNRANSLWHEVVLDPSVFFGDVPKLVNYTIPDHVDIIRAFCVHREYFLPEFNANIVPQKLSKSKFTNTISYSNIIPDEFKKNGKPKKEHLKKHKMLPDFPHAGEVQVVMNTTTQELVLLAEDYTTVWNSVPPFRASGKKSVPHMHENIYFVNKDTEAHRVPIRSAANNPGVLMLFIDNVSRNLFKNRFPKTLGLLEHWMDERPGTQPFASQYLRYHAVGRVSIPNIVPMFRGISADNRTTSASPFFWKYFEDESNATSLFLLEECTDYFRWNFDPKGLTNDHRHRPVDIHQFEFFCHTQYGMVSREHFCVGQQAAYDHMFDYLEHFYINHTGRPTAAAALFMDAHDNGRLGRIGLMDDRLHKFLLHLDTTGVLNHTAVFIVSDHGNNNGYYYRKSDAGHLENKLPTLFSIFPGSYVHEHPEYITALKHNEQALVSAYDIYETFVHLATGSYQNKTEPGYSLLHKVPYSRTCDDAHLFEFCACEEYHNANTY